MKFDQFPTGAAQAQDGLFYQGEALQLLIRFPSASVDAVVTDPPYSSGGAFRSDRNRVTTEKYQHGRSSKTYPDFEGDNRDQRTLLLWMTMWLTELKRVVRPHGMLAVFTDWRQLPTMTDAIQLGGFVWRGIVPWDKTEATRPTRGWFRSQSEYCLVATNGALAPEAERPEVYLNGAIRCPVDRDKVHLTQKPVKVLTFLMGALKPGSIILDPFAGGGSTAVAARELGLGHISIEMTPEYYRVACDRLGFPTPPNRPQEPAEASGGYHHPNRDFRTQGGLCTSLHGASISTPRENHTPLLP